MMSDIMVIIRTWAYFLSHMIVIINDLDRVCLIELCNHNLVNIELLDS
jgi:hypothetical protein